MPSTSCRWKFVWNLVKFSLPHWANIASSHATLISVKVLAKSTIEDTCNETITIMIMTLSDKSWRRTQSNNMLCAQLELHIISCFLSFPLSLRSKRCMMEKRQYLRLHSWPPSFVFIVVNYKSIHYTRVDPASTYTHPNVMYWTGLLVISKRKNQFIMLKVWIRFIVPRLAFSSSPRSVYSPGLSVGPPSPLPGG